jgi:hypothetical protein
MARRMLVHGTLGPGCVLVLRCVLRAVSALRRAADQVQGPEGPVAEEQRPYEEKR